MTVYIVMAGEPSEGGTAYGVYSTRAAAEQRLADLKKADRFPDWHWSEVQTWTVDRDQDDPDDA